MSFFRSDTINYYKLVLPRESAWEIMNRLGKILYSCRGLKDHTYCPNNHSCIE